MALSRETFDQSMSPGGQMLLHPPVNSTIFFIFGFEDTVELESFKAGIRSSGMLQIPRFRSVVVLDPKSGAIRGWKQVQDIDIDSHVIVVSGADEIDQRQRAGGNAVQDYVAELAVGCPMATDKPMWEFHVLVAHQHAVLRVHHAVGDGLSIASMLRSCFQTNERSMEAEKQGCLVKEKEKTTMCWGKLERWCCSIKFIVELSAKTLLVRDRKTIISGGAGTQFRPRKLQSITFLISEIKLVKRLIPQATVNDVIFTVLCAGLSRYLRSRSSEGFEKMRVTCACMVNLQNRPGLLDFSAMMEGKFKSVWGNRFGVFLLPVHCDTAAAMNPLEYLKSVAKPLLDRKKKSLEANFVFKVQKLAVSWFGAKFCSFLAYRMLRHTTFLFSNLVGPPEVIAIGGNRVTFLGASVSSLPQGVIVHIVSYAGKANMEIMVAEDAIKDPEILGQYIETAFAEMKAAVSTTI